MSDQSFFSKLFAFKFHWVAKLFHASRQEFVQASVDITTVINNGLKNKLVDFITALIPGSVDNTIVDVLRKEVPLILAEELLIQDVGTVATQQDAEVLASKMIDVFGGLKDEKKQQLFTSVAARIYIFLKDHSNGEKVTFGEAAVLVEAFYQELTEK